MDSLVLSSPAAVPRVSEFVEKAKWLAFGLMFWNHVNLFVLDQPDVRAAWFLGGLVFPLFALSFVLVVAVRPAADIRRIGVKLAQAAALCFVLQLLVRPALPVNVLLTFACAALAFADYSEGKSLWCVWFYAVVAFVGEYSVIGFFLLFFGLAAVREKNLTFALMSVACVLPLSLFLNFEFGQFLLLVVVPLLYYLPFSVPRIRNFFLVAYVGQYPILWAMSKLLGPVS